MQLLMSSYNVHLQIILSFAPKFATSTLIPPGFVAVQRLMDLQRVLVFVGFVAFVTNVHAVQY